MPDKATACQTDPSPQWPRADDLDSVALLLDVDGTILDIATTPSDVVVPAPLRRSLRQLHRKTGGAVALVSGRRIGNLDLLFAPLRLPAIGGHGAEMRISGDRPAQSRCGAAIGEVARREIAAIAANDPRIIIEDKGSSLAVHYRLAPNRGHALKSQVAAILDRHATDRLEAICGKAVIEIKPQSFDKGSAVLDLMKMPPFANRRPIFVGDDTTDESVFAVLPMLDGRGYSVERTIAGTNGTFGSPREVRCWLGHLCAPGGTDSQ
jgi:trehalose 6-phosphate phosphatase